MRANVRALRATLSDDQRRVETMATINALRFFLEQRNHPQFTGYLAIRSELDLSELIDDQWAAHKRVWLPRIVDENLVWHAVGDRCELHDGAYHIPEPDPRQCKTGTLPAGSVAIIPGLAFGADGRRLGQGGGYFDRWLDTVSGITVIGVGFSCQRVDDLPLEDHDHFCDGVLLGGTWVRQPT